MKAFLVKNSDSEILYKASTASIQNSISKLNAQEEAVFFAKDFLKRNPELSSIENLYVYCSDDVNVMDTLCFYTDELIEQARQEGRRGFLNLVFKTYYDDRLNSGSKTDEICAKIVSYNRFQNIRFKPDKVRPYIFLAAGLSKLSKMPKKKFRENIYSFLTDLVEERSENDIVLIFAAEDVFEAMQKYPELHQFCYFGDEKIIKPNNIFAMSSNTVLNPVLDVHMAGYMIEDGLKSKKKLKTAQAAEIIIEKPEGGKNKKPVYLKYAEKKAKSELDSKIQRGE